MRAKPAEQVMRERAAKTIDITPDWRAAVRIYAACLENGNAEGRAAALCDLQRCAAIADACGPLYDCLLGLVLRDGTYKPSIVARVDRAAMKRAEQIMAEAGCFAGDNAKPRGGGR